MSASTATSDSDSADSICASHSASMRAICCSGVQVDSPHHDRVVGRFARVGQQVREVHAAELYSTRAIVDSSCSGLNGLTIQPVAPACLPRCLVSWPDSVVSTSMGVNL